MVTEPVIMFKGIFDKQDSIFWKHTLMVFLVVMPKMVQDCKRISFETSHLIQKQMGDFSLYAYWQNLLLQTEIITWERFISTFKSSVISSPISPKTVCSIVQIVVLLLKHFYSTCLWRSLDSFTMMSLCLSKEVSKKNRDLKVFSGKSLDFLFSSVGLNYLMWIQQHKAIEQN